MCTSAEHTKYILVWRKPLGAGACAGWSLANERERRRSWWRRGTAECSCAPCRRAARSGTPSCSESTSPGSCWGCPRRRRRRGRSRPRGPSGTTTRRPWCYCYRRPGATPPPSPSSRTGSPPPTSGAASRTPPPPPWSATGSAARELKAQNLE